MVLIKLSLLYSGLPHRLAVFGRKFRSSAAPAAPDSVLAPPTALALALALHPAPAFATRWGLRHGSFVQGRRRGIRRREAAACGDGLLHRSQDLRAQPRRLQGGEMGPLGRCRRPSRLGAAGVARRGRGALHRAGAAAPGGAARVAAGARSTGARRVLARPAGAAPAAARGGHVRVPCAHGKVGVVAVGPRVHLEHDRARCH